INTSEIPSLAPLPTALLPRPLSQKVNNMFSIGVSTLFSSPKKTTITIQPSLSSPN
uniref:Uncharacterized protein n=1 Tax=Oryza brachyantha TaxID=4533 RepID=J3LNX8_ORYBR